MTSFVTQMCYVTWKKSTTLGALYINAREATPQQQTLKEMGHKQPPTPMQTDNTTALGVENNNIQSQCTKAMDM